MQESHRGSGEPSEICAWHIRQRASPALMVIPSPQSRNSTSVPSVKPYFSLSASGITILPSLSIFLITPPKNKKCANRSQRTKNANSVSRQTNSVKQGSPHIYRNGICVFNKFNLWLWKGYNIPRAEFRFFAISSWFDKVMLSNLSRKFKGIWRSMPFLFAFGMLYYLKMYFQKGSYGNKP